MKTWVSGRNRFRIENGTKFKRCNKFAYIREVVYIMDSMKHPNRCGHKSAVAYDGTFVEQKSLSRVSRCLPFEIRLGFTRVEGRCVFAEGSMC